MISLRHVYCMSRENMQSYTIFDYTIGCCCRSQLISRIYLFTCMSLVVIYSTRFSSRMFWSSSACVGLSYKLSTKDWGSTLQIRRKPWLNAWPSDLQYSTVATHPWLISIKYHAIQGPAWYSWSQFTLHGLRKPINRRNARWINLTCRCGGLLLRHLTAAGWDLDSERRLRAINGGVIKARGSPAEARPGNESWKHLGEDLHHVQYVK